MSASAVWVKMGIQERGSKQLVKEQSDNRDSKSPPESRVGKVRYVKLY